MRLFVVTALASAAYAFTTDLDLDELDASMLDWFTFDDFLALATSLDEDYYLDDGEYAHVKDMWTIFEEQLYDGGFSDE